MKTNTIQQNASGGAKTAAIKTWGGSHCRTFAAAAMPGEAYYWTLDGWIEAESREQAWERYWAYLCAPGGICQSFAVWYRSKRGLIADARSVSDYARLRGLVVPAAPYAPHRVWETTHDGRLIEHRTIDTLHYDHDARSVWHDDTPSGRAIERIGQGREVNAHVHPTIAAILNSVVRHA